MYQHIYAKNLNTHKVAVIQMVSCGAVGPNLITAKSLIQKAVDQGAGLIILPENFAYVPNHSNLNSNSNSNSNSLSCVAEILGAGRIQDWASRISQELGIWLVAGGLPLVLSDQSYAHASLLFNSEGNLAGHYEQLHVLDFLNGLDGLDCLDLNFKNYQAGQKPVVIKTPFGNLGLAIGEDLRFPSLFLKLRELGADMICVSAGFTRKQGLNHWKPLLLARAIENQCYVLAANQGGVHDNGCETLGSSMIINPLGLTQSHVDIGPGLALGEIDLLQLQILREEYPIFNFHRKFD